MTQVPRRCVTASFSLTCTAATGATVATAPSCETSIVRSSTSEVTPLGCRESSSISAACPFLGVWAKTPPVVQGQADRLAGKRLGNLQFAHLRRRHVRVQHAVQHIFAQLFLADIEGQTASDALEADLLQDFAHVWPHADA